MSHHSPDEYRDLATSQRDRVERWTGKPRVVEMMRWDGTNAAHAAIAEWVGVHPSEGWPMWMAAQSDTGVLARVYNTQERCWIDCPVGHRVAKGRLGEYYPISQAAVDAGFEQVPSVGGAEP